MVMVKETKSVTTNTQIRIQPAFGLAPIVISNRFMLLLTGPANQLYQVEVSSNLVDWALLLSTNSANGTSFLINDGAAGSLSKRFYRARTAGESFGAGQGLYIVQGLRSNTLVAGKTTAFRMFCDSLTYSEAAHIETTVLRPDGSQVVSNAFDADLVPIAGSSLGPSLVVRLPGSALPWVGGYSLVTKVFNASGGLLAQYNYDRFDLLPTRDLLVAIDRVWAGVVDPGTPEEIQAARDAMARLAAVYPIRDGISTLDGDQSAGLRYVINNNPMGQPCQDCQLCPFFASWENQPAGMDSINAGIAYRFPDPGEGSGGNSRHTCSGQSLLWADIVWQAPLAQVFCQETGHNFGLEPPQDPHYDPNVQAGHSKDVTIDATDAGLGFDIQFNQAFPSTTFDIMFPTGPSPGWPSPVVSMNSWDWEYLREQFVNLSSTGPTTPTHFITDDAPGAAGVSNTVYFLAKRSDGRIYYNRAVLGQAGVGWTEMEGDGRTDAPPAGGAVGTHLFVAIKGLDGNVYLNQADLGGAFNGFWSPMGFSTDVAPAVAGVGDNVYVFAKSLDGRIFYNRAQLGGSFLGWVEVDGNGRTDAAPAAGAVGTHVFVTHKGLDGNVYLNQADLGGSFNGFWSSIGFGTDVGQAVTGVGNNVYVFAKSLDGRIFYNRAQLGQSFLGWTEVDGNGRTAAAPAAGGVFTHVFVAIKGLDGRVYVNQADLGGSFNTFWSP